MRRHLNDTTGGTPVYRAGLVVDAIIPLDAGFPRFNMEILIVDQSV